MSLVAAISMFQAHTHIIDVSSHIYSGPEHILSVFFQQFCCLFIDLLFIGSKYLLADTTHTQSHLVSRLHRSESEILCKLRSKQKRLRFRCSVTIYLDLFALVQLFRFNGGLIKHRARIIYYMSTAHLTEQNDCTHRHFFPTCSDQVMLETYVHRMASGKNYSASFNDRKVVHAEQHPFSLLMYARYSSALRSFVRSMLEMMGAS